MKRGKYVIKSARRPVNEALGNGEYKVSWEKYWWWTYVAPNGEQVCTSEILTSEANARKSIASIKRGWFSRIVVE